MTQHPHERIPASGALGAYELGGYERHADALFSLALSLCRDPERAVDAVAAAVALSHRGAGARGGRGTAVGSAPCRRPPGRAHGLTSGCPRTPGR
ncbi:hypothetical protein ACIOC1_03995 [Streptomyces sp. NPDC088197]|uniref:hypothetical protein n=1 Tax=Streptomyces sp. NPDC088197 TaxID=3365840 RepID=UPI003830C96D